MLKVFIDEKEAVLPADVELQLKFANNLLEARKDDATYPFTLSLQANRHIFKHPERIVNNTFETKFKAIVRFGPYNLLNGIAMITDISDTEIELFISTSQNSFWGWATTWHLDQSFTKVEIPPFGKTYRDLLAESLQQEKFYVACPLYDSTMTAIPEASTGYKIWEEYVNYWQGYFSEKLDSKYCVFIPFPRLRDTLQAVVASAGYTIGKNYLEKIPDYKNILIICRRQYMSKLAVAIDCGIYLPHIFVKDFIEELERKFGVVFVINEASKNIDIISFNDYVDAASISITDSYKKTIMEEDDVPTGYVFSDKEIEDNTFDEKEFRHVVGRENDAQQINCISNSIGTITKGSKKYGTINCGDTGTFGDPGFDKSRDDEFRLAVYTRLADGGHLISDTGDTGFTLKWESLYNRLHTSRVQFLMSRKLSTEFIVSKPSGEMLSKMLKLFSGYSYVRGQRYVLSEQSISVSANKVTEYNITGFPY